MKERKKAAEEREVRRGERWSRRRREGNAGGREGGGLRGYK